MQAEKGVEGKCFFNPQTLEEGPVGYTPRGKPAEAVLRAACKRP